MQRRHENDFFVQPIVAEIIEVVKTAAELKKGLAGVKKKLGGQYIHGAYDPGADNFNLPEKEGGTGPYFIFMRQGIGAGMLSAKRQQLDSVRPSRPWEMAVA